MSQLVQRRATASLCWIVVLAFAMTSLGPAGVSAAQDPIASPVVEPTAEPSPTTAATESPTPTIEPDFMASSISASFQIPIFPGTQGETMPFAFLFFIHMDSVTTNGVAGLTLPTGFSITNASGSYAGADGTCVATSAVPSEVSVTFSSNSTPANCIVFLTVFVSPTAPLGDTTITATASDDLAPSGISFSTIIRVSPEIAPTTAVFVPNTYNLPTSAGATVDLNLEITMAPGVVAGTFSLPTPVIGFGYGVPIRLNASRNNLRRCTRCQRDLRERNLHQSLGRV